MHLHNHEVQKLAFAGWLFERRVVQSWKRGRMSLGLPLALRQAAVAGQLWVWAGKMSDRCGHNEEESSRQAESQIPRRQ